MTIGWGPIDLMAAALKCSFYIRFMDVLFDYIMKSQLNNQICKLARERQYIQ